MQPSKYRSTNYSPFDLVSWYKQPHIQFLLFNAYIVVDKIWEIFKKEKYWCDKFWSNDLILFPSKMPQCCHYIDSFKIQCVSSNLLVNVFWKTSRERNTKTCFTERVTYTCCCFQLFYLTTHNNNIYDLRLTWWST